MLAEGKLREENLHGTINCDGINANGEICGVTTTSGLAWKIPGRLGDSPILGAGLYVDGGVGAAGSTGRGEAIFQSLFVRNRGRDASWRTPERRGHGSPEQNQKQHDREATSEQ
jgi:isoaspartyl peptidase/L-asparaginase-like protein (Ntn-hydrolase superfamily)